MENRRHMRKLAEKWAHQNESMRVQGIAQSRLADFKIY
jgi:hypothetical protein